MATTATAERLNLPANAEEGRMIQRLADVLSEFLDACRKAEAVGAELASRNPVARAAERQIR